MNASQAIAVIGLVAMAVTACAHEEKQTAPRPSAAPITLGEKDTGKKLTIERGQRVIVRLEGNITTGYTWLIVKATADAVLKNLGATFAPGASGAAGSGGTQSWSFEGVGAGEQEMLFEYRRPWERDSRPAKTVSYTITVR